MATQSMTNALFTVMDRRRDGVLSRDEFNDMAFHAIHNNPLAGRSAKPQHEAFVTAAPIQFPSSVGQNPYAPAMLPQQPTPTQSPPIFVQNPAAAFPFTNIPAQATPSAGSSNPPQAPPTMSQFMKTPVVNPAVVSNAPTKSMTNALFKAMERTGEYNQMAVTAVHNNPLVKPDRKDGAASAAQLQTTPAANVSTLSSAFPSTMTPSSSFPPPTPVTPSNSFPVLNAGTTLTPSQSFGGPLVHAQSFGGAQLIGGQSFGARLAHTQSFASHMYVPQVGGPGGPSRTSFAGAAAPFGGSQSFGGSAMGADVPPPVFYPLPALNAGSSVIMP